jgi:hypothetical protein
MQKRHKQCNTILYTTLTLGFAGYLEWIGIGCSKIVREFVKL